MARSTRARNNWIIGIIVVVIGFIFFTQFDNFGFQSGDSAQPVSAEVPQGFVVPSFNALQANGEVAFGQYCQSCHGQYGLGSDAGPPFMHAVYVPGHHGDQAFVFAAANGVRQHHWPFGDMPPVEDVSASEVEAIIAYVRALQRANGIG